MKQNQRQGDQKVDHPAFQLELLLWVLNIKLLKEIENGEKIAAWELIINCHEPNYPELQLKLLGRFCIMIFQDLDF